MGAETSIETFVKREAAMAEALVLTIPGTLQGTSRMLYDGAAYLVGRRRDSFVICSFPMFREAFS